MEIIVATALGNVAAPQVVPQAAARPEFFNCLASRFFAAVLAVPARPFRHFIGHLQSTDTAKK